MRIITIIRTKPKNKQGFPTDEKHRMRGAFLLRSDAQAPIVQKIKPSPVGRGVRDAKRLAEFSRWENILPDEGMQAAGTAWCDILLCTIPHQSLTRQLPTREALKDAQTFAGPGVRGGPHRAAAKTGRRGRRPLPGLLKHFPLTAACICAILFPLFQSERGCSL